MKPHIRFTINRIASWQRVVRDFEITLPSGARIWITTDGWKLLSCIIDRHQAGGDMHYGIALGFP